MIKTTTLKFAALPLAALATYAFLPVPAKRPALILQLKGTAVGEMRDIDTDGDGLPDTSANCFDVPIFNPVHGKQIGTAMDCLSDVNIVSEDESGPSIALTGTTFFNFPSGTLVTQGLTTVRPVLQPTTRDGVDFTHVTGANGDGGVVYGDGPFAKTSGKVRLSGLVDLSRLGDENEITFDCVFIVDR